MSNSEQYSANLEQIIPFCSRNPTNIQVIDSPSFWINDVEQTDNSHQLTVAFKSDKYWLKFNQAQGDTCSLFPIDGNEGVFRDPPPVNDPSLFIKSTGKTAGGCDMLLVNEKFWFGEFKTNATSPSLLQIADNRLDAMAQLGRTLTYFQEQNLVLNKDTTTYLIITPSFFQKTRVSSKILIFSNDLK